VALLRKKYNNRLERRVRGSGSARNASITPIHDKECVRRKREDDVEAGGGGRGGGREEEEEEEREPEQE
jgi:hypothetical protein